MKPWPEGEKIPKTVHRYDDFEFINSIKGGRHPERIHPSCRERCARSLGPRHRGRFQAGQHLLRAHIRFISRRRLRPRSPTRSPLPRLSRMPPSAPSPSSSKPIMKLEVVVPRSTWVMSTALSPQARSHRRLQSKGSSHLYHRQSAAVRDVRPIPPNFVP